MIDNKCKTCIGRLEYRTSPSCKYCRYNRENYYGRNELKMIQDNYKYVGINNNDKLPFKIVE